MAEQWLCRVWAKGDSFIAFQVVNYRTISSILHLLTCFSLSSEHLSNQLDYKAFFTCWPSVFLLSNEHLSNQLDYEHLSNQLDKCSFDNKKLKVNKWRMLLLVCSLIDWTSVHLTTKKLKVNKWRMVCSLIDWTSVHLTTTKMKVNKWRMLLI